MVGDLPQLQTTVEGDLIMWSSSMDDFRLGPRSPGLCNFTLSFVIVCRFRISHMYDYDFMVCFAIDRDSLSLRNSQYFRVISLREGP